MIAIEKIRSADRKVAARSPGDIIFRSLTWVLAVLVLVLLGGVVVSLIEGSLLALRTFGFDFIATDNWNPVLQEFGGLAPIYGTLVTSVLAMLIAVPLSFGIALFLTEMCPVWLKRPIGTAIELLAAVPSIIYGMWGLFVLVPIMQSTVQPFLIDVFGPLPIIGILFSGAPFGIGILTAGLILGLMVLPFITAVVRDVFVTVPPAVRESAYALGATPTEVVWNVILPYSRIGVVGAIMLGLGRALGETMAVTFVIGNAFRVSASLLAPGTTIASGLASQFGEAFDPVFQSALLLLGLILFVMTFIVLAIAKILLMRLQARYGG